MLELNEVLIEGESRTLSMMAHEGQITCLTGDTPERLTRWLCCMMGFERVQSGFVSIDGEPLTDGSAPVFRRQMAFAPMRLDKTGVVKVYEPPTVQDVFNLAVNSNLPISNGILAEEMRRVSSDSTDPRVQLLAVAALLNKPILLVDDVLPSAMHYLRGKVSEGKVVIVTSMDEEVMQAADVVVEI
jgi:ABC-type branched-subunit amino acid transport system ATPase component